MYFYGSAKNPPFSAMAGLGCGGKGCGCTGCGDLGDAGSAQTTTLIYGALAVVGGLWLMNKIGKAK